MLLRRCQNTRVSLCSASAVVVDLVQEYGKNCVKENKRHPFSQESEQERKLIERMYYYGKDAEGNAEGLCGQPEIQ